MILIKCPFCRKRKRVRSHHTDEDGKKICNRHSDRVFSHPTDESNADRISRRKKRGGYRAGERRKRMRLRSKRRFIHRVVKKKGARE
jgi:hypothetical protein